MVAVGEFGPDGGAMLAVKGGRLIAVEGGELVEARNGRCGLGWCWLAGRRDLRLQGHVLSFEAVEFGTGLAGAAFSEIGGLGGETGNQRHRGAGFRLGFSCAAVGQHGFELGEFNGLRLGWRVIVTGAGFRMGHWALWFGSGWQSRYVSKDR